MALLDVYVLCARRDLATVARFRERWLGGMSEAADGSVGSAAGGACRGLRRKK